MKILSKYKDFYDYLSGIWGEDPKVVLDRRTHNQPDISLLKNNDYGSLFICGDRYDFAYKNGEFIYLSELEKHYKKTKSIWWADRDKFKRVEIPNKYSYKSYDTIYSEIVPDVKEINKKLNCPIVLVLNNNYTNTYLFPKLSDLQFNKVMKPEEIYIKLSNWLSPTDNIVDNRTNDEKIITNGFDKKISFRNIK